MIQDQYEEEYFVSFLQSKKSVVQDENINQLNSQATQNSGSSANSGKAANAPAANDGMVYKYFSELTEEETEKYECRPDIGSEFG